MFANTQSFLFVLLAAASAPIIAGLIGARFRSLIVPVVVCEMLVGILIGPEVLGVAHVDDVLLAFSQLGLGFLFFFAGYEIRIAQIKGRPLKLASKGWVVSLLLAYSAAIALHQLGVIRSGLLVGSAIATTAIGTLIPVLRDEKRLGGEFGRNILAIGAVGEFGPVLIITVLLTATDGALEQIVLLCAFVAVAVLTGIAATGAASRWLHFVTARMDNSGQLPIRLTVLLVFALVVIASGLGMDVILGAFAAGMIMRVIVGEGDFAVFDSKLEAVGFGFLIPFFFVISGMNINFTALLATPKAMIEVPIFLMLMLLVRGLPAMLFYRGTLPKTQHAPLALLSATQLPLVVAITTIGVDNGHMREVTAAALVTAALLSVLIFPSIALRLLGRADRVDEKPEAEVDPEPAG